MYESMENDTSMQLNLGNNFYGSFLFLYLYISVLLWLENTDHSKLVKPAELQHLLLQVSKVWMLLPANVW